MKVLKIKEGVLWGPLSIKGIPQLCLEDTHLLLSLCITSYDDDPLRYDDQFLYKNH